MSKNSDFKVMISVPLKPWIVPNFATGVAPDTLREQGLIQEPSYPLKDLSPEVLSALCDQFRKEVFAKAGKLDPKDLAHKQKEAQP